jgi:hypothetical protein
VPALDVAFDYLQLLEIEPAAVSVLGSRGLRELIKKKKKEWTSKAINPLYQQEARWNLERIRQFEALIEQPEVLEAYVNHRAEAQAVERIKQEGEIRKLVALAGSGRREISPRQRELLKKQARSLKMPESLVEEAIRNLGFKVTRGSPSATSQHELPYRTPVMDKVVFTEIQNWLKVLDRPSLYALLDVADRTSPYRLVTLAKILHSRWSKVLPKTSECTAWEKTSQACLTYLKDDESKDRYDNALFNRRLDRFIEHIDLVLAGPPVGREEQVLLARLGVEDFGFSNQVVQECIAARAAEKGVSLERPAQVTVQVDSQVQCQSCFVWNDFHLHKQCRGCGNSLLRRCANPACRTSMPISARVCSKCKLRVSRGKQYVALLDLVDVLLNRGNARSAVDACQFAAQILPGPDIDHRLSRAEKIRALTTSLKSNASRKAWSAVQKEMVELLALAPQIPLAGIPDLKRVTEFLVEVRERLNQAADEENPATAAKAYLACLMQWSDCEEAARKARHLAQSLERQERYRSAWNIARKLTELQPAQKDLLAYAAALEQKMKQAEQQQQQIDEAIQTYGAAVAENRLYAAEKALHHLQELGADDQLPDSAQEVRLKLVEIREETQAIKRLAETLSERDPVIARYAAVLHQCRDCREALAALQSAAPDPPAAPTEVRVELAGNRRRISWEAPAAGKQPTSYVLQRSLVRPGSRQEETQFKPIYSGTARHYIDDDIAHCGTWLRYAVTAVLRNRVEVDGDVLRDFEVSSLPVSAPDLLLWQEVMNLRSMRLEQTLQLTWYQPSAVRQVLIERWKGGPQDRAGVPVLLPATGPGMLVDGSVEWDQVYTYQVIFVYDGPEGEFRTLGATCTDALVSASGKPAQRAGA